MGVTKGVGERSKYAEHIFSKISRDNTSLRIQGELDVVTIKSDDKADRR